MNIFKRYFLFKALDSASKENAQNNITMAGFLNDHISLKIIIDGWFEKRELNALKSFFSQISDGRGEEVVFGESIRFFHMFHRN